MTSISSFDVKEKLRGQCPLCSRLFKQDPQSDAAFEIYLFSCEVCGRYGITVEMVISEVIGFATDAVKSNLSAIVRRHFDRTGQPITITLNNWKTLESQAPATNDVPSKVRYLLGYIAHKSRFPGGEVTLTTTHDYPVCFAMNDREFVYYLEYAIDREFIKKMRQSTGAQWIVALTPIGWEETNRTRTLESPYAFVAMSLWKDSPRRTLLDEAFVQAIKPAIEEDAGYEEAIKIDNEPILGDIVYEIMARIKECRFVVADVTDHRHGVYFEGGYAMGMGLPVIWMCHKDSFDDIHFDTRNMNHIKWDDIGQLRKDLANHILGSEIGRGPKNKISD